MHDELDVLSRTYSHLSCSYGYLNHAFSTYIPDISLEIHDRKYAITITTNVSKTSDSTKAKSIQKQRDYYTSLGYEPLLFIERSNLAVDIDGKSLVLWETEHEALSSQAIEKQWQEFLSKLAPAKELHQILNLPNTELHVKTIMYITPAEQSIAIEAFHVLEQPNTTPFKAYFLSNPYQISFSQAFKLVEDRLLLTDPEIEKQNQLAFAKKFEMAKEKYLKEQKELKLQQEEKERQEQIDIDRRKQLAEEKSKAYHDQLQNSKYGKADKTNRMEMLRKVYNANN